MTTATATKAKPATVIAPPKPKQDLTVKGLLEVHKDQIALALPKHMTVERMIRVVLTELNKNPELGKCSPISFCAAVIQCAQLGLEPGGLMGHAYLVPFWNSDKKVYEVSLIPGYRGLMALARRSGDILSMRTRVIHANDKFKVIYGLREDLMHEPTDGEPGDMIGVYAVAEMAKGPPMFEHMTLMQIQAIKNKVKNQHVWNEHFEEMARKTAVRRLFKSLPASIEMSEAALMSDLEDIGVSQGNDRILTDIGVRWDTEPTVPPEPSADDRKTDLLTKIENKIAERIAAGADATEIEKSIGMALSKVENLSMDALVSVWGKVSK